MFKYPARSYLYHYGLKAHLPFGFLRRAANALEQMPRLGEKHERQRVAREILMESPWRDFVPADKGFRKVAPGEIPGMESALKVARDACKEFKDGKRKGNQQPGNPFAMLLDREDFEAHPELLETALSSPLVDTVTSYFGAVPRLDYIGVWVATPNLADGELFNSQLFHLDKIGDGYMHLFTNVHDLSPDNGPLLFLDAEVSDTVRRATRYERRAVFGNGRLSDEEIDAVIDRAAVIELTGPAGTGAFIDTSRCFHAGSRCTSGERVTLVFSYVPWHRNRSRHLAKLASRPKADSRVAALLLAGTPAGFPN